MAIAILQKGFQLLSLNKRKKVVDGKVFGSKIGLTASLFGCWHESISRPFTDGKTGYRTCLKCGARTPFNTETLETQTRFYYPPIVKSIEIK